MLTCDPTLLPISIGQQWVIPYLPCCMTGFSCWRVISPGKAFSTPNTTLPIPHPSPPPLGVGCVLCLQWPAGKETPSMAVCSTLWHRTNSAGRLPCQEGHGVLRKHAFCFAILVNACIRCSIRPLWYQEDEFELFQAVPLSQKGLSVCSCSAWQHNGNDHHDELLSQASFEC